MKKKSLKNLKFRIIYLVLLVLVVQIVLICLYPREVFRANEILYNSSKENSYIIPFTKQIALINNANNPDEYDLFIIDERDKQMIIYLKSEGGKLISTSHKKYCSLNGLISYYNNTIYVDTVHRAIYTVVTKEGNKYYLLKAWKTKHNRLDTKLEFIYEFKDYNELQDSIFEINDVKFYPLKIFNSPEDSLNIENYLDGFKLNISEKSFHDIKFYYPPYIANEDINIEEYISEFNNATGKDFTENDIVQLIMFYRRNKFYQELIFGLPNYQNRGFLPVSVIGKLDANNDNNKDILICIHGHRYLNTKLICYDEKNKRLIWEREFASILRDFKIVDIDHDGSEELIFSSYSPGSQPKMNYLQKADDVGLPFYAYVRVIDSKGKNKIVNARKMQYVEKEEYISIKFLYLKETNQLLLGAHLPYQNTERELLVYDLNINKIRKLKIKCRSVTGLSEANDHTIRIFDSSEDELRINILSKDLELLKTKSVKTDIKNNLAFYQNMFGEEYIITSPLAIYDNDLNQLFTSRFRLDFMPFAFHNNELMIVNISKEDKGFVQPTLYRLVFNKDYYLNITFVIIFIIEIILLLIYFIVKRLISMPVFSGVNSYAILNILFGRFYFWKIQGNITKYYKLPKKYSDKKAHFYKILEEISDDVTLFSKRNLLFFKVEIYEIESHEEFPIIQTLAHDLKNQILLINFHLSNFEERLISDELFNKYKTDFQDINKGLMHVSGQMKKLTQFSHINKLYKEETNSVHFIEEIIFSYLNHPLYDKISFNHGINNGKLQLDQNLIKMAILNLITNALDEIDNKGYVNVQLSESNDKLYLQISNPCKMDLDVINKIEEIGFSMKKNSSGLGVPIAKKIIEKHQGNFSINYINNEFQVSVILPYNQ